ncbi:MAG TPA: FtsX-like permease family protein, partial [Gemmataceae bacterium]|nr:FtsX-like permease family protein [Gemmataceae bacterium]
MLSVYLTLSLRYLRRRWFYALMIIASIASGVCLLVATRAINQTMSLAAKNATTPMAGAIDLILSNDPTPIDKTLVAEIMQVPGVQQAQPRIFETVKLPDYDNRTVLMVGLDLMSEMKNDKNFTWQVEVDEHELKKGFASAIFSATPAAIIGKALDSTIDPKVLLNVQPNMDRPPTAVKRAGAVDAHGPAASLGGNLLILDLAGAAKVMGWKSGKVSRIDITYSPKSDRDKVQAEVLKVVNGRADVRTPQEQNKAVQNVMSGMQTALLLCGIAALIVGLFLVYNALSVSVAERRHEIGILLSVGATRWQIRKLFAGEAVVLGLAGSLLGIPLGIGCAYLALEPVRGVLEEIFFSIQASYVEVDAWLVVMAIFAGVTTAVFAALVPAFKASRENPADAVRRMPLPPTLRHRFLQITASAAMMAIGFPLVLFRSSLPERLGMYAGLGLVMVGALLAMPLLTALIARGLQPLFRRFLGLEIRLAADNLVRSPGRTGIVIAAVAAGVALVIQTAGTIKSNRVAIRQWVDDSIAADLVVTCGGPISAGGQGKTMNSSLVGELEKIPGVERAMPARMRKPIFNGTQIMMLVFDAEAYYQVNSERNVRITGLDLFKKMTQVKDSVIISDNLAYLHGVRVGDVIPLSSTNGPVNLTVIGQMPDYSWNHGSIFVNRQDYDAHWDDQDVDVIDIYVKAGADKEAVRDQIMKQHTALGLWAMTREEMQDHIDGMIERLYGIAYAQQFVVLIVAALGVVTALLISVLQRRREMGLLRAIG